jgi:DHA2 family multidrug resistance protein
VLIPLSQTVLLDAFPRERRGQAMAIWGIAIMVAPIVGPTIGGYITEHFVWRWVFYVNVPIGVLALLLAFHRVPSTPPKPHLATDWTGLVLMSLALGSLQAVLDLGHHRDWFESRLIMALALVACVSGVVFVLRGLAVPHNIIDLRLFRDRNFTLGCVLIAGYCLAMYGTIVLLPLLTQRLLGYPADTAGLVFLPRGAVSAALMILIGSYLAHRVDPRKLIGLGFVFTTVACWHMAHYTLAVDMWGLVWPGVIQGIGMALIFGQISVVTFDTVPRERADEAAGLYSVTRTLGSALGVALSGTLFVRQEQVHWNLLGGRISEFNPDWQAWLERASLSLDEPGTPAILAHELLRQAQMQAFADVYWAIAVSFLFLMPCVALLRRPTAH